MHIARVILRILRVREAYGTRYRRILDVELERHWTEQSLHNLLGIDVP